SRVLVLDEPTAALTGREVAVLLEHLRRLRARGTACIYISHKLDEVFAIADRITVLRDGATVTTLRAAEATVPSGSRLMVGREITEMFPRRAFIPPHTDGGAVSSPRMAGGDTRPPEAPLLRVENLSVAPAKGAPPFLRDLTFELRAGEVLGFGGLMGAGRTELL